MLPKTVQIGPVTYTVKETEDLHNLDSEGRKRWLHGHIQFGDVLIKIADDQDEQVKLITVWHEALHGILQQAGMKDHPEGIVEALGFGIVQLIRDNPELISATVCKPVAVSAGNE